MNDSIATISQEGSSGRKPWLLLIHHIPPKPDYFRVKVRRRLQSLGALPLKNSVYVLPARDETTEDFQWLLGEIVAEGGEATLCAAALIVGTSDADLEERFRAESEAEYAVIARAAHAIEQQIPESSAADAAFAEETAPNDPGHPADARTEASRLRRRLVGASRKDFFRSPGREAAHEAVQALSALHRSPSAGVETETRNTPAAPADMSGRTWITRAEVFVDRIASAWLIRRFIDPHARFRFLVPGEARSYRPSPGEVRFDMFHGDYTHEGDRCTFETLVARFGLPGAALKAIGEIVHDIDCKDDKFGRPEAFGVESILSGIVRTQSDDANRILHSAGVFDGLYAQLTGPG